MSTLGYKHTGAAKAKIAAAMRARVVSDETRARMAAAGSGRRATDETKAKMSAALRRYHEENPISDETKAKIAAASSGELSSRWRGDTVGYYAAHQRHVQVLPRACAHEDDTCKGDPQSAFRHDTPAEFVKVHPLNGLRYSTRPEDYMTLCQSHHRRYDHERKTA